MKYCFLFTYISEYKGKSYNKIDELLKEDILLQKYPSVTRNNFNLFLKEKGLECNPKIEVGSHGLLVQLVENDFGIAILTKEFIKDKIENLQTSMQMQLGVAEPKIAICGLNPHCGENGMFGDEELTAIIPAIKELRMQGINISGPFPADALFTKCALEECNYDCYVAMYHDQGLIPVKLMQRDNSVNTTIGLDVIRTSPAHGTAFDIAGQNIASPDSMINAISLAIKH